MLLNAALLKSLRSVSTKISLAFVMSLMLGPGFAVAQSAVRPVADRLVQPIDEKTRVTLARTVHPLANQANDRGAVTDGLKLERLQILLKRSDAQEAELKQLIGDLHTPGSASYHKWLTPDDFGNRFGPSDGDVAKLSGWLQSHGFSVTRLNPGRQTLEVTGSAGQFRDAFKAQIHSYQVKSATGQGLETHYANAADPQIPAALAPVFGGFASLNNFRPRRSSRKLGAASYNPVTHESKPEWTISNPSGDGVSLALAPADFAVQYSLPSQATAGTNDGTGQSIAIVNDANINISLVNRFRALFKLPANPPQVIIDGNDPGIDGINDPDGENGDSIETYLDVEWAGAVAPGATVSLVIGADTALEGGLQLAAGRAVYSNIAPVISMSFGECESSLGSQNAFWSNLWEQAAAQGITVMVSAGDSGSAACDDDNTQAFAVRGQAVNGFGSTPYNLSIGGTDFFYSAYNQGSTAINAQIANYWSLTPSNNTPMVSLKMPVPEQPWNDSQYGKNLYSDVSTIPPTTTIAAGSGGASTLGLVTGSAPAPYPKPSWQKGAGVPADSARDLPDVSLFAADGSANDSYYPICFADGDCEPVASTGTVHITGVGGTSASSPSFAGVMALVDQQYGRQGQAGFVLYPLATQFPAAFNDVTVGTNTVPCNTQVVEGTSNGEAFEFAVDDCIAVTGGLTGVDPVFGSNLEGEIGLSGTAAYNAGAGYDLASGLGTVNVSNLLTDWNKVTFGATAVTLTPSSTSFAHGTAVTISGGVTGTGTPTGDVALMTDSTTPLQAGQTFFTLANGAYSGSVSFLPGGTYNIWGNYGGDNANALSSSIANKVQVTVAPEASTTSLTLYTIDPTTGERVAAGSGVGLSYGEQVLLSAQPSPSSGSTSDSLPTGSVAFMNGSATLTTAVLNVEGDAEYLGTYPASATPYTITAAYSGDSSYAASKATVSVAVSKDTPLLGLYFPNMDTSGDVIGPQQTTVTLAVENSNYQTQHSLAPTGAVTVTGLPGGAVTANLSATVDPTTLSPEGIATIAIPAGMTSGTLNLQFSYAGDSNYSSVTGTEAFSFVAASSGQTASTTAVAASSPSTSPAAAVQLTTTITGQSGKAAPTGTIQVFGPPLPLSGEVSYFGSYTLPAATGDSVAITLQITSEGFLQGSNQLTVQYSGDGTYLPSSGTVTVSNPLNDFQMVPLTTIVSVPTSGSATDTIVLTSTNSFSGAVSFTCAGAGGITCSLNPSPATLTAGGSSQVSLTVNSAGVTTPGTYNVVVTGSDSTGNFIHTLGFQVVVPALATGGTGGAIAVSATAITIASQGASGTSTVTVTPSGGYTGSVALACAITASPSGATDTPTCALTPPSVSVTGASPVTTTLTVNTTAQTSAQLKCSSLWAAE